MPNPTNLLTAVYLVIIAAATGGVYTILTQGGELLAFIPKFAWRLTTQYAPGSRQLINRTGWRKSVNKLASCGKCVAGQFALWLFFPLIGYPDGFSGSLLLLHFGVVVVTIYLASILNIYVGSRS